MTTVPIPPTVETDALTARIKATLRRDLEQLWTQHNHGQDGTTQVDSTSLAVIAVGK
ncbi:hypothetical protein BH10CHL1_BH10CHL1_07490 [soil metagenome]